MQHGQRFLGLAHDEVFGDLQLQAAGFQAVVREQLFDAFQQVGLAQLRACQVHRQRAERLTGLAPYSHLAAGLLQHPVADLQDHAVFFRQGNEVLGRHFAKGRVVPADQGFCACQCLGRQVDFGLVGQCQLIALQGSSQFLLKGDALTGLLTKVAGIAFDPVAAFCLGTVHRRVGIFDQRGYVCAVGGEHAAANAGADVELMFASLEGRVEAGQ